MALRLQARYIIIIVTLTVMSVSILGGLLLYQFSGTVNELSEASSESSTKYLREQIDKRGHAITSLMAENLVNPLYLYDMEEIYELIKNVKTQPDIKYVYVYDVKGKVIHDGSEHLTRLEKSVVDQEVIDAMQKQGDVFSKAKGDTQVYAMPIWIGDEPIGGVMVAITLSAISTEIQSLKSHMDEIGVATINLNTTTVIITIVVLAVIGILFSIIIARHLINPIRQLINQTMLIKDGMYGATIDLNRKDELGELVQSFNDMTLKLQSTTVSKRYMENIFDSMSDALVVIRPDLSIELVNKAVCRMLGYKNGELIGKSVNVLFGSNKTKDVTGWIIKAINKGETIAEDKTYLTKDGHKIPVSISTSVMKDSNGTMTHIICMAQDNTERIKMQKHLIEAKEEAESANSAKSEFLARMSHELRTPMNAVLGFGQLLGNEHKNLTKEQNEYVNYMIDGGQHLLDLINEVLDIAKIDAAKMDLLINSVSLNKTIDDSMLLVMSPAKEKNIALRKLSDDNFYVQADETRLKQVLVNILSNAVKYNNEGGTVDINIKPIGDEYLRISISDTGLGITVEDQKYLFEPFMRVGGSAQAVEGTGVGLTITKKLIELMNGHIGFNSKHGKGSTFWIELPLAAAADEVEKQAASSYKVTSAHPDELKILYIEDNATNFRLMETMLKKVTACDVVSAVNAEDGIEMVRGEQPDLILMDIDLPGMSGFDALEVLKADENTSHIPVIAVSAHALVEQVEKGKQSAFNYYLTKPIDMKELVAAINAFTDLRI